MQGSAVIRLRPCMPTNTLPGSKPCCFAQTLRTRVHTLCMPCATTCSHTGRALDAVPVLPLLSSLDLSYNALELVSLMAAESTKPIRSGTKDSVVMAGTSGRPRRRFLYPAGGGTSEQQLLGAKFPALEHLDLSWNLLCDLDGVLRALTWGETKTSTMFFLFEELCRERVLRRFC